MLVGSADPSRCEHREVELLVELVRWKGKKEYCRVSHRQRAGREGSGRCRQNGRRTSVLRSGRNRVAKGWEEERQRRTYSRKNLCYSRGNSGHDGTPVRRVKERRERGSRCITGCRVGIKIAVTEELPGR